MTESGACRPATRSVLIATAEQPRLRAAWERPPPVLPAGLRAAGLRPPRKQLGEERAWPLRGAHGSISIVPQPKKPCREVGALTRCVGGAGTTWRDQSHLRTWEGLAVAAASIGSQNRDRRFHANRGGIWNSPEFCTRRRHPTREHKTVCRQALPSAPLGAHRHPPLHRHAEKRARTPAATRRHIDCRAHIGWCTYVCVCGYVHVHAQEGAALEEGKAAARRARVVSCL